MSRIICLLLILSGSTFAEDTRRLRVINDGVIRGRAVLGETIWIGTMTVEWAGFHMNVKGQTTLYSGPSIERKPANSPRLRVKDLQLRQEWISLIALGEIVLTRPHGDGTSQKTAASKVVYLPADDRVLVDGKLWPTNPQAPPAQGSD